MTEKKRKWNAPYDDEFTYTCYELVTDTFAVYHEFMTKKTLDSLAYEKRDRQIDSIGSVSGWWVHLPGDEAECHYFGKCSLREARIWGDKKWILDNLTPDIDEFDARVFARMRALAKEYVV